MSAKVREIAFAGARKHIAAARGFLALFVLVERDWVTDMLLSPRPHDRESVVTCCRMFSGDDVPRTAGPSWALNTRIMHACVCASRSDSQ